MSEPTDDELRVEIAKALGWENVLHIPYVGLFGKPGGGEEVPVPHWPTDPAAAMALQGEIAARGLQGAFAAVLYEICTPLEIDRMGWETGTVEFYAWLFRFINATPRQRALAAYAIRDRIASATTNSQGRDDDHAHCKVQWRPDGRQFV